MKKISIPCGLVMMGVAVLLPLRSGLAQDTSNITTVTVPVTHTTMTTAGNITGVLADRIFVKSEKERPIAYLINDRTKYLDDQEAPVPPDKLKAGRAVIIEYALDGDNRIASKIVVRNAP
jgi:hypothetical protein